MVRGLTSRTVFALIFMITLLGMDGDLVSLNFQSGSLYAQVEWFPSPSERLNKPEIRGHLVAGKARVLFFISPGCHSCPEEAAKLEEELKRLGWRFKIEGIFLGGPREVGKYLAALQGYPFKFELELDMDGKVTRQYGVKTFPSAVIEVEGKRAIITRASDLENKLR